MQDVELYPELSHITAWFPRGDSTHGAARGAASARRDRGACGLEYEGREQAVRSPRHLGKRWSAELQGLYWLVGQSHGALCSEKTLPQPGSLVETEGLATDGTLCRVVCPGAILGASPLGAPPLAVCLEFPQDQLEEEESPAGCPVGRLGLWVQSEEGLTSGAVGNPVPPACPTHPLALHH